MAYYLKSLPSPTVLEVGVSGFLPLYKQIFPEITLVAKDRPPELGGANAFYCIEECKAERHDSADLSNNLLAEDWVNPHLGSLTLWFVQKLLSISLFTQLNLFQAY